MFISTWNDERKRRRGDGGTRERGRSCNWLTSWPLLLRYTQHSWLRHLQLLAPRKLFSLKYWHHIDVKDIEYWYFGRQYNSMVLRVWRMPECIALKNLRSKSSCMIYRMTRLIIPAYSTWSSYKQKPTYRWCEQRCKNRWRRWTRSLLHTHIHNHRYQPERTHRCHHTYCERQIVKVHSRL